jgi:hypothetical protein
LNSLPPQCSGATLVGWDWAEAPTAETVNGVTWGRFHVVGTYADARNSFTVTKRPALPVPSQPQSRAGEFTTPCATPAGGWRNLDPAKVTLAGFQAMTTAARSQPDFSGLWLDNSTPVDGRVVGITNQVVTIAFTGRLDRHRAEIENLWGGPVCIVQFERSRAELDAILRTVLGPLSRELGLRIVGVGAVDEVTNTITPLDVMLAPSSAQRTLDRRFGVGVVRLHQVLTPLESDPGPSQA